MPLVTGLAIGGVGAAPVALAVAAALAFVAHEPLLVVLGQRGARLRAECGREAGCLLAGLGGLALLAGAGGVALAPPGARPATLVPAGLGLVVVLLVWRRRERTVPGELLVAAALSSCGFAVAAAGSAPLGVALRCWVTWLLAFAAVNVTVHTVLGRLRSHGAVDRRPVAATVVGGALGTTALLVAEGILPSVVLVALLPTALTALALTVVPVPPRRVRTSGWALMAATGATALLLILGMR
jgi:hypothetical protein